MDFPQNNHSVKEGSFLVDVRSTGQSASRSANSSINIPLDQLPKELNQFKDKKHLVVFCRTGNRNSQGKGILAQNGLHNVIDGALASK